MNALNVLCTQLTHDLFAMAKFLLRHSVVTCVYRRADDVVYIAIESTTLYHAVDRSQSRMQSVCFRYTPLVFKLM